MSRHKAGSSWSMLSRLAAVATLSLLWGCASGGTPLPTVDAGPSDGLILPKDAFPEPQSDSGTGVDAPTTQLDAMAQYDAQHDVLVDTAPPLYCPTIMVHEFQTEGSTSNDEFIEVAGPPGGDLTLHRLVYRAADGTSDVDLFAFSIGETVPASGFLVISSNGWDGLDGGSPFGVYNGAGSGKLAAVGGGLAIRRGAPNTGTIIDSVGYGTATNAFVQGSPAAAPQSNKSSSRSPRCASTGNNSADFSWTNPSPGAP